MSQTITILFCSHDHDLSTDGALSKPRTTHRLDSATGGLVVIAKTHESETRMNQMLTKYSNVGLIKINLLSDKAREGGEIRI